MLRVLSSYFCFYVLSSYLFSVLFFVIIVLISCCYFTDWTLMILLTYPIIQNQITNQINKYNHNTTILFFNPDATSFFLLYYCGKKRTIKGDNKRKYKRNKGKGTSSQNSGRERGFFFLFFSHFLTTVDHREAGLLITF